MPDAAGKDSTACLNEMHEQESSAVHPFFESVIPALPRCQMILSCYRSITRCWIFVVHLKCGSHGAFPLHFREEDHR